MAKTIDSNFIHIINRETQEELYRIRFDFGTQKVDVKDGVKITLDYVHGGFREVFKRVGDDLIIGDDTVFVRFQRLGVGFGKEVWDVVQDEDFNYNITVTKYSWAGGSVGYVKTTEVYEKIMTPDELAEFQGQHNVTVGVGENTLYTTWPVLPNPTIYYHMNDCGDYDPANGKIVLRNYFKYGKDTVYIGDRLLSDIIQENPQFETILSKNSKKPYNITDTFFSENLFGGDKADKIRSYLADDTIDGGKGNDKIILGSGNKTIVIAEGDGKDTIYNFEKADSVNLKYDEADDIYYTKSKNNLIINRTYGDKTEQTVINNYFKNYDKDNKLIISQDELVLTDDLTKELLEGTKYLTVNQKSTVIKGTDLADEAFSTNKNEIFALGKGNDVIRFRANGMLQISPYQFGKDVVRLTEGSHVTLDMSDVDESLSVQRVGNDAVVTAYHRIELCGRDNGKEDWVVMKGEDGNYKVIKTEYYFTGTKYSPYGTSEELVMTASEVAEFEKENGVKLNLGKNTYYTSWAVVPNPIKHYSYNDGANYGMFLGSVTIKDYFSYGADSVYIGDKRLSDYFDSDILIIDKSDAAKKQVIKDSAFDETIFGSDYADKITSNRGDDVIAAGRGDDKIVLGKGDKIVNINKGDGKDTIIIKSDNTSTLINFDDAGEIEFKQKKNDLIIERKYDDKTEQTVIKDYYKNNQGSDVKISVDGFVVWGNQDSSDLLSKLMGGTTQQDNSLTPQLVPEIICSLPPIDNVEIYNGVNQDISAWQTDNGALPEITEQPSTADDISSVLVQPQ